jgi:hypothetical protein
MNFSKNVLIYRALCPIHRFLIPETGIFRAIPHNSLKEIYA